ncbi:MAG: tRNA (adenosine(37)-N6)-threonylcarbamoyltransferase complex dimerization subunit type 1 TsaB [Lachnospiraceae bacterium]|nr:tRNA (adenosine(37)-N6)-threonylcarbamoyltransferase complex dimerization subunit type 1 TsaB [Lachnospiraceae bacterium]
MKILALDSSGIPASVALLEDNVLKAEYTINHKKTHSQTLLPMLDEIKNMTELELDSVDAIALTAGPGSFTGLRIGSATAKGIGLALSKPLIAVPTVDAIAYGMYGTESLICPIMDARRNQVYTGVYEFVNAQDKPEGIYVTGDEHGYEFIVRMPQCAVDIAELCDRLNEFNRPVVMCGDGVPVFKDRLNELLKVPYTFAPSHLSLQKAGSVATLGAIMYRKGMTQTAAEHSPEYLRLSQAERERKEKNGL